VTFTADLINVTDTASAATSRLFARQVGGADRFVILKSGAVTAYGDLGIGGTYQINTVQVVRLPDQVALLGSSFYGSGGASLSNTTGNEGRFNTGVGVGALRVLTTGFSNTAVGYNTLEDTTTGTSNTGIGTNALFQNITGANNVGVGDQALGNSTANGVTVGLGGSAGLNATSDAGVFVGYQAGRANAPYTATGITAVGYQAAYTGSGNYGTFLGYRAGFAIAGGTTNTFLGYQAGDNVTTGSNNIVLGNNIDATSATGSNQLNIGNIIFGTGVSGTGTTIAGSVGIGTTSPSTLLHVAGVTTLGGNLLFSSDNTYDIGASGATRPRTVYTGTSLVVGTFPAGQPVAALNGYGSSWALTGAASETDAADKAMRLGGAHYSNAEQPVLVLYSYSSVSANSIVIGGGSSAGNAATTVSIYTAANNTTTSGTQRWLWDSSGHFLAGADNTYDIGASSSSRPRDLHLARNLNGAGYLQAGAGSYIYWSGRSLMASPSNGVITLTNNAETDFTRLQFGGTTSSFPAIGRNGAGIWLRLADNSNHASLECAGISAYGEVRSSARLHAYFDTAIPAGGTAGVGVRVSNATNFGVFFGSGAPTLSAAKGSLYLRSDGSGATDRFYINTDGGTTWTAGTTVL
jgi:hypothetical protein